MSSISRFLLPLALIALVSGVVMAGIYPGNNVPITLRNNDDNSQFTGLLVAYGDVSGPVFAQQCFEGDNGLKPAPSAGIISTIGWVDGNASYSYSDYCTGPILHEFVCSKNVKFVDANGGLTQVNNLVALVDINCNAIGYSTCNDSNAVVARCV